MEQVTQKVVASPSLEIFKPQRQSWDPGLVGCAVSRGVGAAQFCCCVNKGLAQKQTFQCRLFPCTALLPEGTVLQRGVMCTGGQAPGGPAVWAVGLGSSPDQCPACTGRATNPWLSTSAEGGRDQRPGNTAVSHPVAVCKCLFKYEHSNSL